MGGAFSVLLEARKEGRVVAMRKCGAETVEHSGGRMVPDTDKT